MSFFSKPTPSPGASLDSGQTLTLTAQPSYGNGVYSFAWTKLPGGCLTANTAILSCVPTTSANASSPSVTVTLTDGLGQSASLSISISVDADTAVSAITVASSPVDSGQPVTLSATPSAGSGSYKFDWLNLPTGCSTADVSRLACTPSVLANATDSTIALQVTDSHGYPITSNPATLVVYASPTASSIVATPAAGADSGQTVVFVVTPREGDGTYSFVWTGLPNGCVTKDTSRLTCVPTVTTNTTYPPISVTVTDGLSETATGVLSSYKVFVAPSISTPTASPGSTLESGQTVSLSVVPSGGSGTYTFLWTGLPSGCSSSNSSTVACTPNVPTNTSRPIVLDLTDSVGGTASSQSLTLTIYGPLAVSLITANPAGSADRGSTVTFNVSASAGQGSYAFVWTGLPAGCVSSNVAVLTCAPTDLTNTTYPNVRVTATDGLSVSKASSALSYAINGALTSGTITVTPAGPMDSGQTVTFSTLPSGADGSYSFAWTGLPTPCVSANSRTLTCTANVSANRTFSSVDVTVTDAQGTAYAPAAVSLTVYGGMTLAPLTGTPSSLEVGQSVTFDVGVSGGSGGSGGYSFAWSGLPSPCVSSNLKSLSCSPTSAGANTVVVKVTDSLGMSVGSSLVYHVYSPVVSGTLAGTLTALDTGSTTTLALSPSGGLPPYTIAWTGLPTGCASVNSTFLNCTPSATGTFNVRATVTDRLGASEPTPVLVLVVGTPPQIATLTASLSILDVGQTTTLSAHATDGTSPMTFLWSGLPTGCQSANSSTLSCTPLVAGPATIVLKVTDRWSGSATLSVHVTVNLDPSIVTDPAAGPTIDLTVGRSVLVHSAVDHGTPGYGYTWYLDGATVQSGANGSYLFAPSTPGNYLLWVSMNDSAGYRVASPHLNLTVQSSGGGVGSGSNVFEQPWLWILLVAIVAIVALVLLAALLARRGRNKQTASGGGGIAPAAGYHPGPGTSPAPPETALPPPGATPPPSYPGIAPSAPGVTLPPTDVAPQPSAVAPAVVPAWPFQPLTVLETHDEKNVWKMVGRSGLPREGLLCFTRETLSLLTGEYGLQGAVIHRLSRLEGENNIEPGNLEKIGDLVEQHLSGGSGRAVVIPSLEVLVEATSVKSVGRLLEVCRDVAQTSRGAVLVSFDPKTLPENHAALLRRGAVRLAFDE